MKPCWKNRKRLVWLATDILPRDQANKLRTHIQGCPACRGYLEEIEYTTRVLAAPGLPAEVKPSPGFHRRVTRALAANATRSPRRVVAEWSRLAWIRWRMALPITVVAFVVAAGLFGWSRRGNTDRVSPAAPIAQAIPSGPLGNLAATVSNYERAVQRSPEALDELISAQARKNVSPAPLITASSSGAVEVAE